MKKNYLNMFAIVSMFSHTLFSQTNWSVHSYDDAPKLLANVNGFQFFVNSTKSNSFGNVTDTTGIIGIMPNGKIKFRYHTTSFGNIKNIIKTYDNCLALVGEMFSSCDVMPNSKPCVLLKLDTNGIPQFTQTVTITYTANAQSQPYTSVIQKPDSSYLVFSDGYFHNYSKIGVLISNQTHSLGNINASAITTNSTILISHSILSGTTTTNYLSVLDLTGSILNTSVTTNSYSKFSENALGDYYGLTSNHIIEKINLSLTVVNTSNLSQGTFLVNDFDILNDTLYACGNDVSNHSAILKFDKNLTNQYIHSLSNPNYNFTSISCQTNSLNIVAYDWASNSASTNTLTNKSTSYFKTNLLGNINLTQDAYVSGISVNNGNAYSLPQTNTMSPIYSEYHYQLNITVFNAGTDTLKSVYLNMLPRYFQDIACGYHYYHQLFTGLSIAPNTFSTIVTNYINDETYSGSSLVAGTNYTLSNICAWTSSPNFKSDANHANDAFCGNIVLPVTTGISEQSNTLNTLSVFPNPASQYIQFIHLKNGINYQLTCYDVIGKEIQTQCITAENNSISLNYLNNGIYVFKISDGNDESFHKIVVQK